MYTAQHLDQPVEIPAGGIASFLIAETGSWADDDDFPDTGIGSIREVADKLAEYGRYEDTYMVHAAEGETVVPMEVFDRNPALKQSLFAQMREMGIQPEEYIVGNELNSRNPVTGQPEFFLKKFFRGLKKGLKKVFKVVAPIVVQAVLTPILGPAGASAATQFLNAKVQGASTKDALKSAGIAALTTVAAKGVQSKMQGGTFGEGVRSSVTGRTTFGDVVDAQGNPVYRPSEVAKVFGAQDQGQGFFQAGTPAADFADSASNMFTRSTPAPVSVSDPAMTTADSGARVFSAGPSPDAVASQQMPVEGFTIGQGGQTTTVSPIGRANQQMGKITGQLPTAPPQTGGFTLQSDVLNIPASEIQGTVLDPTLVQQGVRDAASADLARTLGVTPQTTATTAATTPVGIQDRFAEIFKPSASGKFTIGDTVSDIAAFVGPGPQGGSLLQRYGVPAALTAFALTDEGEMMEEGSGDFDTRRGIDIYRSDPSRYGYGFSGMAQGGQAFPRRTGRISGPGTETSDDIPAMLSDGEFVMTAQAVRGAGNGSRKQGMRKMYDMMRRFESAA